MLFSGSNQLAQFKLFFCMFLVSILAGCGTMEPIINVPHKAFSATVAPYDLSLFDESIHLFEPVGLNDKISEYQLVQRVDNLIVLVDSTSSSSTFRGIPEDVYQREVLRRFNRTLPRLPLGGGVWSISNGQVAAEFGTYMPAQIEARLDNGGALPSIGTSDLQEAISRATDIAASARGRTALLLLTRWDRFDTSAIEAVERFYQRGRAQQGFKIIPDVDEWEGSTSPYCVYAIGVGNSMSRSLLEGVDRCGATTASDSVMQPRDMAHFVENMLFIGPADTDQDGIYDYKDQCPDTPIGQLIGFDGCAKFKLD